MRKAKNRKFKKKRSLTSIVKLLENPLVLSPQHVVRQIPIVDLFAGPGGLGEGFSSFIQPGGASAFKIVLSVEKDKFAHSTLLLRSFFRKFRPGLVPQEYYDHLRGKISYDRLLEIFPKQAEEARKEALHLELGNPEADSLLNTRIPELVDKRKPWILIGGPPCQAYSIAGRSRMRPVKGSAFEEDHRHFLYQHYLKILAKNSPHIFIMENVKGIASASLDGEKIFGKIVDDLHHPLGGDFKYDIYPLVDYGRRGRRQAERLSTGLHPLDFVIESERHGIPQCRHRLILFGIRSDLGLSPPRMLSEVERPVCLSEILSDLPHIRSTLSKEQDSFELWSDAINTELARAEFNTAKVPEILRMRMENAVTELIAGNLPKGANFVPGRPDAKILDGWYFDERLDGFCNHEARAHMRSDLLRYLFVSSFAREYAESPKLRHFDATLLPNHKNVFRSLEKTTGLFNDRFRAQLDSAPATTITSHIMKDGHFYIHPDPSQCRSLTVREAARIQTFPDNYFFQGPRTQQYLQVGNAVPPLLANKIAAIAYETLEQG